MKSLWDFPSRAAALEALGLDGFVAAAIRQERPPRSKPSTVLLQEKKNGEPCPAGERPGWTSLVDREPEMAVA